MKLEQLNSLSAKEAQEHFARCCGSKKWIEKMVADRPFADTEILLKKAEEIWAALDEKDILEVLAHHPKIGDKRSFKEKFKNTANWSSQEQKGVSMATDQQIEELARGNIEYEKKFGFIFLIFATGKTPGEMLAALKHRLKNNHEQEIHNIREENRMILLLRIKKLLELEI